MSHSDDHREPNGKEVAEHTVGPVDDDEVHSSATLDFDELTTSRTDAPAVIPPTPIVASGASSTVTVPPPRPSPIQPQLHSISDASPTPMERVTFSNLEALVPERIAAPVVAEKPASKPVERRTTIHDIRPPSFKRFLVIALVVLSVGITLLFGLRIEWDFKLVQTDPAVALNVVLGLQAKPQPVLPKKKTIVQTDTLTGEIRALDLQLERLNSGALNGMLVLRGHLQNGTNRIQRKVMLRASLVTSAGLTIESQRQLCCTLEDTPKRPASDNTKTIMKPGDVKYFSFIFPKKSRRSKDIKPKVEIIFSEAERVR
jgi:hypothetical protein